jgi:hypothetical protein
MNATSIGLGIVVGLAPGDLSGSGKENFLVRTAEAAYYPERI